MFRLLLFALLISCVPVSNSFSETMTDAHKGWSEYGGAPDSAQYSALSQISRTNVNKLQIAWVYRTGDDNRYAFNPLVAHGLVYVLAKNNSIVALDAASGKEVWVHATGPHTKLITHRGINYWESKDGSDRRLLFASENSLQALDARTGQLIESFGDHGRVDLRAGLGRDPASLLLVQSTTPGRVFENLIILGSATNEEYRSAPGDIRAYDVRTGKLAWTFHTVPHPGEYGYRTWPKDAWKAVGGADSWSELTLDETRGIVYVPTASPKYNFYGANRAGADLFGDCLLALDAHTGKRLWDFQMVHHDIWDYDNATAPKLLTLHHNGAMVDAVAQPSKEGFVWVFDRTNGKPLWPVVERPVPHSTVPGEQTSPTQPFPSEPPPFARQSFTAKDLNLYMHPEERTAFLQKMRNARNEGIFTPPGLTDTVEMPGNNGGANWGGAAVDPRRGTLYVVSKDLPCMLKLEPRKTDSFGRSNPSGEAKYFFSGFGFLFTNTGLPAIGPPWTTLTAYDLNKGTIQWQIPLGDVPELAAKGIHNTGGVFQQVGPVVTAGGLIFVGARDRKLRAIDEATGKVVWEAQVESAIAGVPSVYEKNGKEYVVVCAAERSAVNPSVKETIHGAYVAFALPGGANQ